MLAAALKAPCWVPYGSPNRTRSQGQRITPGPALSAETSLKRPALGAREGVDSFAREVPPSGVLISP